MKGRDNNRQTTTQSNIWIVYIFRDTSWDLNENNSERLADNGNRNGVRAKARNVDRPRLVGALGCSHSHGGGYDVGDVIGLVVDAEGGRGDCGGRRGARLDELITGGDPMAEKERRMRMQSL